MIRICIILLINFILKSGINNLNSKKNKTHLQLIEVYFKPDNFFLWINLILIFTVSSAHSTFLTPPL